MPFWQCPSGTIEDVALDLRWDGASFAREVARRAAILARMAISRGSIVAISRTNSVDVLADLFAAWRLGAAAACLDSGLTDEGLRRIVSAAKPDVLLADNPRAGIGSLPQLALDRPAAAGPEPARAAVAPEDRALLLFTSGTTGEPKGVVLTFAALQARIVANIAAIGTQDLARALVTLPLHFGHGLIGNTLTALAAGGDVVLHPPGLSLARNLGRIIDERRITFLSSVPALWRAAIHGDAPAGGSLARIHIGSAPLPVGLWSEVATWSGAEVVNCYGLTEAANWVAGASSRREGVAEGLVGKPWGATVAVLNRNGAVAAAGAGEILVKSPALMAGYFGRSDLTAAVMREGWLRTGDRGRLDETGCVWLEGRIKEEINRAGCKVQPAEVDAVLERHPAVAEACAFGIPDAASGEAVAAAVRLSEGAVAGADLLRSWCLTHLQRAAVPERWHFVESIPRARNGKVSRDMVRRQLAAVSAGATDAGAFLPCATPIAAARSAADRTCVREAVERAWAAVLGPAALAPDVTWEAAGGDSINALRLWLQLGEALGVRPPLHVIAHDATLEQIVFAAERELIEASRPTDHGCADRRPLVFFLPPAEGDLPALVEFRRALVDKVRFVVIDYPLWEEMIGRGGDFGTLVDEAVAQMRAHPAENYLLTGYSFGGIVAYEIARRITKAGGRVAFLGLIDTRRTGQPVRRGKSPRIGLVPALARLAAQPQSKMRKLPRRLIAALSSVSAFRALRAIGRLAKSLPPRLAFELEWQLTAHVRMKALRRWTIEPLDVPAVLFRSDDEWTPPDYGWKAFCPRLSSIAIKGSHLSLFDPPHCEVLRARFVEMLEGATMSGSMMV
jgi:oxalate---CoA ligase